MIETTELQAATFRRLLKHLNEERTETPEQLAAFEEAQRRRLG